MVERNAQYELVRTQAAADRNTQAMQDLAIALDLPDLPKRIEGYDISHIQGSDAVASQVVFVDGMPAAALSPLQDQKSRGASRGTPTTLPAWPRSFVAGSAAMLLTRTNPAWATPDWPDLVMIDGGKGQLSAVVEVLREMDLLKDLNVVSLAKKREEIFLPGESLPLHTELEQPGVQLLRRLRDESPTALPSAFTAKSAPTACAAPGLSDIPGLGQHRQKELLAAFRSIDYIREASPEQLAEVPGIGPQLAKQI